MDAPWDEIRDAFMMGATATELYLKYGVKPGTIRSKSHREKWPTPRNIEKKILEARVKEFEEIHSTEGGQRKAPDSSRKLERLAEIMADRAQVHRDVASKLATGALKKAKLAAPKTWKDADIADRIARRNLGLEGKDGSGPVINVGVLSPGAVTEIGLDE